MTAASSAPRRVASVPCSARARPVRDGDATLEEPDVERAVGHER